MANESPVTRHRTSRKRMPLFNWSAMVVFWHSAQSPPKRAPESWVPGSVSRARAVLSALPDIQSCADKVRRGAAKAGVRR